ncbi:carbohydrate ABC transporter permease [Listeria booriae]|uniref:carbohydrate ABC transporter permease n=1 Tax=Listeria booriae TaxID=1552123 RepID=UPI001625776F|nr:carbohydrate ABC transporter permease [Listeria booriae]MBC1976311.1 carbohydrate ABC transporter permease [Listeria booriae]MBC2033130.1 carbohydrate ABC transporter permease [Listeria booriae]MBC2316323.1 carbohydrate ABC transporter permease [Listeria booriae]
MEKLQSTSTTGKASIVKKVFTYTIIVLGGVIMVLPFIWMVSTAFKSGAANMVLPPQFIPDEPTWSNFERVFEMFPMLQFLVNSIVVAIVTTVGQMLFCSMAAYAFARIEFWGRDKLFLLYLATMMVPAQVTMIPQFILMKQLGWLDSYTGLIVPGLFGVFGTFLLRQAFMGIPKELDEAVFMDGGNHFTVFRKVILPLAKPTFATLGILTFMQSWNSYLWPLIVTSSQEMATLPLGLSLLQGRYGTDFGLMMAGVLISVIPILAVYLFAQKYFIQGMTMSGMKE